MADTHPTAYASPTTNAFVGRVLSETTRPALKISNTSLEPPRNAKVSDPTLAKNINRLNIPRCESLFPWRDCVEEGPRGLVFGEPFIYSSCPIVIDNTFGINPEIEMILTLYP
jgi:hypothetical protein